MPSLENTSNFLSSAAGQAFLSRLYGDSAEVLDRQTTRHLELLKTFTFSFPHQRQVDFFSSPGRTEVGGNHTDHNGGRVLAAAVDLDILAVVSPNGEDRIELHSEGYPPIILRTTQLDPVDSERSTSTALVRGVCARFRQLGFSIGGFDAVVTSQVPKGSGLSSSAAYELLIGRILNDLFNGGRMGPVLLAQIGQYAENEFFGKPCGLMDQTTCAVGGFVTIDFYDFQNPLVKQVEFDFSRSGYTLVIVDTWGDHAGLTEDYTALEHEMKAVAHALGGQVLRQFSEQQVLDHIPSLREKAGDRAILRAIHFYRDDRRVAAQVAALEANEFQRFLQLINESGESSWMLCQNCYSPKAVQHQGITIALTASEAILAGRGAWRVHGGGFAGTIQAFVPDGLLPEFIGKIECIFGPGSCHAIKIRPEGALRMPL
jgi:galactokinase